MRGAKNADARYTPPICGFGFRVQGPGSRVQGSGFRVQGPGSRVQGSGFRVQGPGSRVGAKNADARYTPPICGFGVVVESLGFGS